MKNSIATPVVAIGCAILMSCDSTPPEPEEALRLWVDEMELAAENKDRSAMLDKIAPGYADARGNSRKDIGDTFLLYFLRQQKIALVTTIDDIKIHDDSAAEMSVTVGMAGLGDGVFRLSADAYEFRLELAENDDEWMLIGARWGELGHNLR